jgi:hypothetical protein
MLGAMTLAQNHRPGSTIALAITHDGEPRTIQLTARAF